LLVAAVVVTPEAVVVVREVFAQLRHLQLALVQ